MQGQRAPGAWATSASRATVPVGTASHLQLAARAGPGTEGGGGGSADRDKMTNESKRMFGRGTSPKRGTKRRCPQPWWGAGHRGRPFSWSPPPTGLPPSISRPPASPLLTPVTSPAPHLFSLCLQVHLNDLPGGDRRLEKGPPRGSALRPPSALHQPATAPKTSTRRTTRSPLGQASFCRAT